MLHPTLRAIRCCIDSGEQREFQLLLDVVSLRMCPLAHRLLSVEPLVIVSLIIHKAIRPHRHLVDEDLVFGCRLIPLVECLEFLPPFLLRPSLESKHDRHEQRVLQHNRRNRSEVQREAAQGFAHFFYEVLKVPAEPRLVELRKVHNLLQSHP